ncbi:MAG: shikimate kinase [Clostridia bacterium]
MTGLNAGANKPASSKQVLLMGFMGAGKSSVGPRLASCLGWSFVDLDRVLEDQFGAPANRQLAEVGEPEFRRREAVTLEEVLARQPLVVALGGGTVTDVRCRQLIRDRRVVLVWLDVDWDTVVRRLATTDRPLWQVSGRARRALFEGRRTLYASLADLRVEARGDPEHVACATVGELEARGVV